MSTQANKTLVRQFVEEVFNKGDLAAVDTFLDTNYIEHAGAPGLAPGPEGFKQLLTIFDTAFPGIHMTIEDLVAEGDRVVGRFTARGTHQGEFFGIPPAGKQVTLTAINIYRIAGGKIAERWGNSDDLGMMQQLGVIPAMG